VAAVIENELRSLLLEDFPNSSVRSLGMAMRLNDVWNPHPHDFIIDRTIRSPAVARHMSATGG
jgi:hypothetical protein